MSLFNFVYTMKHFSTYTTVMSMEEVRLEHNSGNS